MSISGIPGTNLTQLIQSLTSAASGSATTAAGAGQGSGSFQDTLTLMLAQLQLQTTDPLSSLDSVTGGGLDSATMASMFGSPSGSTDPVASLLSSLASTSKPAAASGLNMALSHPEAAYSMMTAINADDVNFKAQYFELDTMQTSISSLQQAATSLGGVSAATTGAGIQTSLQAFADAYNEWVRRFSPDMQTGGILAGTQAAQVSTWELQQSVTNMFYGAADGLNGMKDLGFTLDPGTGLASVNTSQLNSALASNESGVIDTIHQFSASFAKSAALLDSPGNFVPDQLGNLGRAINYLAQNESSLQSEFGTGAAAKPTGQVAEALASYNAMFGTSTLPIVG
jgi:hypothetical protein